MKRFKKISCLLIIILLALSVFASCNKETKAFKKLENVDNAEYKLTLECDDFKDKVIYQKYNNIIYTSYKDEIFYILYEGNKSFLITKNDKGVWEKELQTNPQSFAFIIEDLNNILKLENYEKEKDSENYVLKKNCDLKFKMVTFDNIKLNISGNDLKLTGKFIVDGATFDFSLEVSKIGEIKEIKLPENIEAIE